MGGGLIAAKQREVLESLPLPIGGLMSDMNVTFVQRKQQSLDALAKSLGISDELSPFVLLSFLALPVIPYSDFWIQAW